MTGRILLSAALLILLAPSSLLAPPSVPGALAAEAPNPSGATCCGCGAWSADPYHMVHKPGCPYGPRGDSTTSNRENDRPQLTPDQQADLGLSLLFPIPATVGFVCGGIWHVKRLCGGFKGKSAIRSWSDYITGKYPLGAKGTSGGFWGRAGGLPFLVLYPATWTLVQVGKGLIWGGEKTVEGVAWLGAKTWQGISWPPKQVYYAFAGRPGDKPQPTATQLNAAAANYSELRKDATRVQAEAKESREAAVEKRDAFLDELVAGDPELQKVLAAEGREAARARATKRLDAYLHSYRERAKARQDQQALLKEMNDTIDKADMQVFEDVVALGIDKAGGRFTDKWKAQLAGDRLTQVERHALRLKLNLASAAEATKTGFDAGNDLQDISASLKKAGAGDHDARLEAHEKTGRMLIGFLDKAAPGKIGTVGLNTMDALYCATAHLVLGNQAAELQGEILRTMRPREDALALRWAKNVARVKAAANSERVAGIKLEFYSEMEQKYAGDATGKGGAK